MLLSDLPTFTITGTEVTTEGLAIKGHFNHMRFVHEGGCFLYIKETDYYFCDSLDLSLSTNDATFVTRDECSQPKDLIGKVAYWVSNYWNPCNITYIVDPAHEWKQVVFHETEALETKFSDGSRILRTVAKNCNGIRVYPENTITEASSSSQSRIVPDGWDHEHCEICNKHIDPGDVGYFDEDEHWLCNVCYNKYALPHDLSFLIE
jgi:hypothetical protein